jgi:hypothetical protein
MKNISITSENIDTLPSQNTPRHVVIVECSRYILGVNRSINSKWAIFGGFATIKLIKRHEILTSAETKTDTITVTACD